MHSPDNPEIVAVAACSENRVIGKGGTLPWRVKKDAQFWQEISRGKPVIMGRKSFLDVPPSFKKRPGIIVITRDPAFAFEGITVVHSLEDAFKAARAICRETGTAQIIIGGGGEIYRQALPETETIYLSTIHTEVENGDAFFPVLESENWDEKESTAFAAEKGDTCGFTLKKLVRRA